MLLGVPDGLAQRGAQLLHGGRRASPLTFRDVAQRVVAQDTDRVAQRIILVQVRRPIPLRRLPIIEAVNEHAIESLRIERRAQHLREILVHAALIAATDRVERQAIGRLQA